MKAAPTALAVGLAFACGLGIGGTVLAERGTRAADTLPADIHPETLSRMAQATRDEFTSDEDRAAYDKLVAAEPRYGRPSNGVLAATGTRLHIPVVAEAERMVLHHLQQQTGVERRDVELATIVASREANGEEPWLSHLPAAASLNSANAIEIVKRKAPTTGLDEREAVIIDFGRQMLRGPKVSSKTFASMERLFGRKGTLALTLLMIHYDGNTLLYRAYDQRLAPGTPRPFPDVLAREAATRNAR